MYPVFRQVVIDTLDVPASAEFYRELFGLTYAAPPEPGSDWLVLEGPDGRRLLAFQQVDALPESTWPDARVPQQLHLDFSVPSADELLSAHDRVLTLGGRMLFDRFDDPDEPLRVYADPSGHPFCIFVLAP